MSELTDLQARKLASEWHGGGGTKLYVLASSGAILAGVEKEIDNAIFVNHYESENIQELQALLDYVDSKGRRGPQRGWGCLSW